ncbi:DUF3658 domain-containing protein [Oceanirhabdus seepicola]|uniref:DUF1835 domain-containing protein n=1 Tax=Oceanirhabdus seepicola TaxID=2828781 RepID=A0A9J6NZQ8_9CLOT|nr:DUF1835 domain-containing protein [Oceanirhabdus seepicola]
MGKFVHIVFGDSAAGLMKYFFHSNKNEFKGQVIAFSEDYSIGPIYEIDTDTGRRNRIKWFKKVLKQVSNYDYFEDIEKEFIDTYESIKNIDSDSKIVIWYGENTGDQVGRRYLNALLRNKELYEVNVSQSYIGDYNGNRYKPRALGECAPEEINHIISTMKKLEKEKCNRLINDWEVLRISKENLRILKENKIIGVDESYYDYDILSNCTFNFKKAARVIGMTMGKSHQLVGDTYIDYRVRKLIESGKVEYRGRLETMRDFEIRVFGNLNEFFTKLFKKNCEIDEDGFYHYLLEEKEKELVVDTTHITKWNTIDLSNKLILDYDDNNVFSLSWFKEGRDLISINQSLVGNIEYIVEMYEDENGEEIKTEAIILFLEDLTDKHLHIQLKPYISVGLKN